MFLSSNGKFTTSCSPISYFTLYEMKKPNTKKNASVANKKVYSTFKEGVRGTKVGIASEPSRRGRKKLEKSTTISAPKKIEEEKPYNPFGKYATYIPTQAIEKSFVKVEAYKEVTEGTQLEGLQQVVFKDRYSMRDDKGTPLEIYPEQLWRRISRAIASVEETPNLRKKWEDKFYQAMDKFKFVPAGRILSGAGTGALVTYYNCMPPQQEVLTEKGYKPISEIVVGEKVVTHRNRLRSVLHKFERDTEELIYIIKPQQVDFDLLRVTGEHKIYVIPQAQYSSNIQQRPSWIPAKELKVGDYVALVKTTISSQMKVGRYATVNGNAFNQMVREEVDSQSLEWVTIEAINTEMYKGQVMDMEVEEDHSFISAGVVVSNCFVIPSPEDSRTGILDNLKIMTEIMARSGGVGINLSSLRPRGSYIKTVNGHSSGPMAWAQLYSVATGDVISQGGCFGPNERIATNKGLIKAKELADRLDSGEVILAQTHKGLKPFTSVFRNGTKDLYNVVSKKGFSVQVTLDHKMGVLRNGEIQTIPLRDLKVGDETLLLWEKRLRDHMLS